MEWNEGGPYSLYSAAQELQTHSLSLFFFFFIRRFFETETWTLKKKAAAAGWMDGWMDGNDGGGGGSLFTFWLVVSVTKSTLCVSLLLMESIGQKNKGEENRTQ
jgi:hypothetical protein